MKVLTFAAVAVLAVLAAGCSSKDDGTAVALGQAQGDVAVVGEPGGKRTAAQISYQPGGGASGTLPGITVVGSGTADDPAQVRLLAGEEVEQEVGGHEPDRGEDQGADVRRRYEG